MKTIRILSIVLLLFNALGALPAGVLFIIDPSGAKMGMNTDQLAHSPFISFLIPGIILFLVNGVYSSITAYIAFKQHKTAPFMIMLQGIMLIGWILIQIAMLQMLDPLHYIMGATGFMLLLFGYLLYRNK